MGVSNRDLLAISESIFATKENPPKENPPKETPWSAPVKDDGLRSVEVSDSFMDQVLGFAGSINESKEVAKPSKPPQALDEAKILKERLESLVGRLKSLIIEAKEVIGEMTTTGCLGVGPVTTLTITKKKKGKKRGFSKTNQ